MKIFYSVTCAALLLAGLTACSGDSYKKETAVTQSANGDYVETTKVKGKPMPGYDDSASRRTNYDDSDSAVKRTTTRTETIENNRY